MMYIGIYFAKKRICIGGGTDNIIELHVDYGMGGGPTLHETKLETFLLHLLGAISYKVIGLCILYHINTKTDLGIIKSNMT